MLVTQDRMVGFDKAISTMPQYQVVNEQDANWDPTLSGQDAQQLLAKYGCSGVQAAYGMADYMALPIIQAAKQAGCTIGGKNGMVVTSSNCFKAGIQSVQAGQLYGTATEDPITIANETATYVDPVPHRAAPAAARDRPGIPHHLCQRGAVRRAVQPRMSDVTSAAAGAPARPQVSVTGLTRASAGCRRCRTCPSPSAPGRSTPCAAITGPGIHGGEDALRAARPGQRPHQHRRTARAAWQQAGRSAARCRAR